MPSPRRQRRTREQPQAPAEPASVVDGVPDRSPRPAAWKYVLLAVVFLAWVGFLIVCRIAGAP